MNKKSDAIIVSTLLIMAIATLTIFLGVFVLAKPSAKGSNANVEVQMPNYKGTIKAPNTQLNETQEETLLKKYAKITPSSAISAALNSVNGTLIKVSLDNENGYVVYSVEIKAVNGTVYDVKVDAGNGAVLYIDKGGIEQEVSMNTVSKEIESDE